MKTERVNVRRTTVELKPHEEIAWQCDPRTTVMIQTVIIEELWTQGGIRSVHVVGCITQSGWRKTRKEHTFYGGNAPEGLHPLIKEVTCGGEHSS